MKKYYLLSIVFFIALFFTQQLQAKDPFPGGIGVQLSDATNEYWYYLQNCMTAGTSQSEANRIGRYLTSQGTEKQAYGQSLLTTETARDLQLWKFVADPNGATGNEYFIINKSTGNVLSKGTGSSASAALATSTVRNLPVSDIYGDGNYYDRYYTRSTTGGSFKITVIENTDYPCVIINGQVTPANYLACANDKGGVQDGSGAVAGANPPHTPRVWAIYPKATIDARYPVLSTDDATNETWYYLKSASATNEYSNLVLYDNEGTINAADKDVTGNDNTQKWKFIASNLDSLLYIKNKATENYMVAPAAGTAAGIMATTSVTPGYMCIQDLFRTNETGGNTQFRISGGLPISLLALGRALAITSTTDVQHLAGASPTGALGWDSNYAFYLEKIVTDPTGINNAKTPGFYVSANNSYIQVEGATDYRVYTIYGIEVNPSAKQTTGIYIVKIGNTSQKVYVK